MRLTLSVVTLQEQAPFTSMSHSFDPSGGSVGRHQRADWALLDDRKFLSGEHFSINCDGKDFFIVDTSTNGTFINDSIHPLGKNNSHLLRESDRIRIGEYIIMATIVNESATHSTFPVNDFSSSTTSDSQDPFFSSGNFDSTPQSNNNQYQNDEHHRDSSYKSSFVDPNLSGTFGEKSSVEHASDPFFSTDDSFKPNETPFAKDLEKNIIEADSSLDIYSPLTLNPVNHSQTNIPDESIKNETLENDVFDFLDDSDDSDDDNEEDVFSNPANKIDTPIDNSATQENNQTPLPEEIKTQPIIKEDKQKPSKPNKETNTNKSEKSVEPKNNQQISSQNSEAFKMFLEGAGISDKNIPSNAPPETFKVLGHAVKEVLQGTIELLRARAETKNHLHLDRTIIGRAENNPLKFMPNAEQVIIHLLTKEKNDKTYTPLETALEEAYDDIMAHQFAMTVATQGALKEVMKQHFSPQSLADNMARTNPISSLIPLQRQAKLWSMFEDLYDNIEKEATESFQRLLDSELSSAYEKQLMELKSLRINK